MEKSWLTHKGLLALSFPSVLATMLEPISSIVDTALVGRYDTRSLAALAIGATLISSLTWMFNFLVHAPIQSISEKVGKKQFSEVASLCKISLSIALTIGIFLLIIIFPIRFHIYEFMGAKKELLSLCDEYFKIRILGQSVTLLFIVVLASLRGLAKVKSVLIFIATTTIFNIVFSYLSLYYFDWGIAGVAWSTVVGNTIGLIMATTYLLRVKEIKELFWKASIHRDNVFHMGTSSLNIFGRSAFLTLSFFLATKLAANISIDTLAAHQIILQIWLFASFFTDGVATTGNIVGARILNTADEIHLKEIFNKLILHGVVIGISFSLIYLFFSNLIIHRFTLDVLVVKEISKVWMAAALFQAPLAIAYVYDGFIFGLNRFDFLRNHMMIAFVICFIPFATHAYFEKSFLSIWLAIGMVGMYRLITNYFCLKTIYGAISERH